MQEPIPNAPNFGVLYHFHLKKEGETSFIEAWKKLTEAIFIYENSNGSSLYRKSELHFIALAHWPSKSIWQNSGSTLPAEALKSKQILKESCERIEVIHELELISDLRN